MDRREEVRLACQAFHDEHPDVWELFVRFTFEKIELGYEHYGVDAVLARVRWETDAGGEDPTLKLNNNFKPFYSRRFARFYPEHHEFFRTRRQFSQDRPATGRPEPTRFELH